MTDSKEFFNKLSALLDKYNVDIEVTDDWTGYPECGQDLGLDITVRGKDGKGYDHVDLRGEYFDKDTFKSLKV